MNICRKKTSRRSNSKLIYYLFILALVSSCVSSKKTTYLQYYDSEEFSKPDSADLIYRIQSSDNLFIRVSTPDPRWSEMFNTIPVASATMSIGPQAVDLLSYPVQQDGTVDIPYLGPVEVAGHTLPEVKVILQEILDDYVSDAAITVKLVNNYVSILGEVRQPGRYPIYKEQLNVFQALAMAGDMGDFSNRYKVQIIRNTSDGSIVKEFDLTDIKIVDSEFFYILPNDVIYAQPFKGKFFQMSTFPYVLILSTVTTAILLYNVLQ
ncbi:MAG: polysaccharide biosynthesis/export family protein [Bacteroidales bacterium]|nr:polysaccharide biosynthesis/export family protein [Bacteroidales bacterium]